MTSNEWAPLQAGDLVRLVSPASYPDDAQVQSARAVLQSWGLEVELGQHALDQWGYMAGHDADRLADLNAAIRDPSVRAIVTTRGGAGAYRICEKMDFAALRRDPKPIIGFSDITYLQMAAWRESAVPNIHGFPFGIDGIASARTLLMTTDPVVVPSKSDTYSAQLHSGGLATGRLLGGHLASLTHMVGAGLPSLDGAILLLEDKRDMGLGRIDRQLTQLKRAGYLSNLAGIALGLFTGFDGYIDRNWELADVLNDHLQPLGIPILGGLNIGHNGTDQDGNADQFCVALGTMATLDADVRVLTSTTSQGRH